MRRGEPISDQKNSPISERKAEQDRGVWSMFSAARRGDVPESEWALFSQTRPHSFKQFPSSICAHPGALTDLHV
jgi:hypothetical protein